MREHENKRRGSGLERYRIGGRGQTRREGNW